MSQELSHVALGQHFCPGCGTLHDVDVLLDTRLQASLPHKVVSGKSFCPSCSTRSKEYVLLIEATEHPDPRGNVRPHPTGRIAWIRDRAFSSIFTTPIPPERICYIEPEAFNRLKDFRTDKPEGAD